MKKVKTLISAAVCALAVAGTTQPALAGGIPVIDAANLVQQIQQVISWGLQYEQMVEQINQLQATYNSMTGSRNMGQIFNDPKYKDYLPDNWKALYDQVKSGGYNSLTGTAKAEYDKNKLFDACEHIGIAEQRTACEAAAVKMYQDKGTAMDAFDKAKDRLAQIDKLMKKINETSDPKDIAELQARIASEQAMINNEETKMRIYAMVAEAEDKVQRQRRHELVMKDAAKRGVPEVSVLTF